MDCQTLPSEDTSFCVAGPMPPLDGSIISCFNSSRSCGVSQPLCSSLGCKSSGQACRTGSCVDSFLWHGEVFCLEKCAASHNSLHTLAGHISNRTALKRIIPEKKNVHPMEYVIHKERCNHTRQVCILMLRMRVLKSRSFLNRNSVQQGQQMHYYNRRNEDRRGK